MGYRSAWKFSLSDKSTLLKEIYMKKKTLVALLATTMTSNSFAFEPSKFCRGVLNDGTVNMAGLFVTEPSTEVSTCEAEVCEDSGNLVTDRTMALLEAGCTYVEVSMEADRETFKKIVLIINSLDKKINHLLMALHFSLDRFYSYANWEIQQEIEDYVLSQQDSEFFEEFLRTAHRSLGVRIKEILQAEKDEKTVEAAKSKAKTFAAEGDFRAALKILLSVKTLMNPNEYKELAKKYADKMADQMIG